MPPSVFFHLLAYKQKQSWSLASNGRSVGTCLFCHFKFKTNGKAQNESCLMCILLSWNVLTVFVLYFQKIQQDVGYNNLANFAIEKKIGRGQFSEVYRATYILDHTPVALKKVQVRTFLWYNVFIPKKGLFNNISALRFLMCFTLVNYRSCIIAK